MQTLNPCPFCGAQSDEIMIFADPTEGTDNSGPSRRVQCAVCNVEAPFYSSKAEAITAWNTRPAAPVEGLETVTYRAKFKSEMAMQWQYYPAPDSGFDPDKYEEQALCLQSQAEAIIAAKDAEWQAAAKLGSEVNRNLANRVNALQADNATLKAGIKRLSDEQELLAETGDDDMISVVKLAARLSEAEADNAALTARVKELGSVNAKLCDDGIDYEMKIAERDVSLQALETQLAAAKTALEEIRSMEATHTHELRAIARAALEGKP